MHHGEWGDIQDSQVSQGPFRSPDITISDLPHILVLTVSRKPLLLSPLFSKVYPPCQPQPGAGDGMQLP